MFKKLFSCLGDSNHNEQVADLSGSNNNQHSEGNQNKPMLHPDSNIQGQQINFEMDDFQSTNLLQMHFLQQNTNKQQKYYYEQEDGEVESKITTASPSKTQYYQQSLQVKEDSYGLNKTGVQKQENQNNLYFKGVNLQHTPQLPDFSPNANRSIRADFTQSTQQQIQSSQQQLNAQLTEKKLNNYLQQAKFLISTSHQQSQSLLPNHTSPYQNYHQETVQARKNKTTIKGKPFSQDLGNSQYNNATEIMQMSHLQSNLPPHMQNIYSLDSCPSSQVLFNSNLAFEEQHEPVLSADQINLKASFNSATKKLDKTVNKRNSDARKSYTDKKIISTKKYESNRTVSKDSISNFHFHRNSEFSRASTQQKLGFTKMKTESASKKDSKLPPQQIIDQLDNIILEDVHDDNQQLKVLDYDDEGGNGQMDLGQFKSVNKRQTSKTEVFSPTLHRKKVSHVPSYNKQPLLQQQVSTKSNVSRTSIAGQQSSHKKTLSTIHNNAQGATRNNNLRQKHLTTTTSPVVDKQAIDKALSRQRLSSGKKLSVNKNVTQTQPSPMKRERSSYHQEIQEDQNEDDDLHRSPRIDTQSHPHFQLTHREIDIVSQTISPSTSSNFQFQPKFFKPKFATSSQGHSSMSMENSDQPTLQMQISSIQQQQMPQRSANQQSD